MRDSILSFAGARYLWVSLVLVIASAVAYLWHDPIGVPNGGTWLGYTLGTIAATLILWLMAFGIRKRRYGNRLGSMLGWASAHVYLGTALIVITFLHTGFQVGLNIHTLALLLMLLVIASGLFGLFTYLRYPALMTRNRDNTTRQAMLDEIVELDQQALSLADAVDPKIHGAVLRSNERIRIGGSAWRLLRPREDTDSAIDQVRAYLEQRDAEQRSDGNTRDMPTMFAMVDFLSSHAADSKNEALRKLMDVLARKKTVTTRLSRDLQLQALMEIWLYLHVPLSFALLGALTAHIVSVFFYW
ncbi:MAG TPA: hypothetical protein PLQ74_12850 [Pseudomonadota bacterium]|jgi:hypothetical protein|nr:hypothetical protein [Xanthomonadales bacterium]HQW82739.1 hypothetical protein [Pseudomonadota bacterium]